MSKYFCCLRCSHINSLLVELKLRLLAVCVCSFGLATIIKLLAQQLTGSRSYANHFDKEAFSQWYFVIMCV
jgi:hypothetical protein